MTYKFQPQHSLQFTKLKCVGSATQRVGTFSMWDSDIFAATSNFCSEKPDSLDSVS